jgi:hypothetical protein
MKKLPKGMLEFVALHIKQILCVARITHFDIIIDNSMTRCAADIRVDYTYLRAFIRFGKETREQWIRGNKPGIVETLCHELSHIITGLPCSLAENREEMDTEEEQATELMARILFRLYQFEVGIK